MELPGASRPVTTMKIKYKFTKMELRELAKKDKKAQRRKKIEEKKRFIGEIEQRPAIWDRNSTEYRQKDVVDDMWTEVATTMQQDKQVCKKFWKHLVDHFRGLLMTLHYTASRGDLPGTPQVTWPFFESMLFMKNFLGPRSTTADVYPESVLETTYTEASVSDGGIPANNEVFENGDAIRSSVCAPCAELVPDYSPSAISIVLNNACSESPPLAALQPKDNHCSQTRQSRVTKRQRDTVNDSLLEELQGVNRELNASEGRPYMFTKYLSELLASVPEQRRRQCENDILKVVNGHADGQDVVVDVTPVVH